MAALGIGVKVATLPVIALGVGIGVDYGIYIYRRCSSTCIAANRCALPISRRSRAAAPPWLSRA
jgi:hypothetical protein